MNRANHCGWKQYAKRLLALLLAVAVGLSGNVSMALAYGEVALSVTEEYSLSMDIAGTEEYKAWKKENWTEENSSNSAKVLLTPGADMSQMNFSWYSEKKNVGWVSISTSPTMIGADVYSATVTDINRKNWKTTYKAVNHVTVTGLKEDLTYYYSYSGEPSDVYSFTTGNSGAFQVLVVGDPQIGASGTEKEGTKSDANIPADAYTWNHLLNQAKKVAPKASFLLSAGDQINFKAETTDTKGIRESEYAGFLYPSVLRSLPVAAAIGNHESKGEDFKYHFHVPNSGSGYGRTNSGCDYYYRYGNALFIVLNSNSRDMAAHKKAMAEAVASYPDAKWRIVMMHHDIYGSGVLHSNGSAANLRILFAPLMDDYNVDLVIGGHDHSYARSYYMLDGTAINYGSSGAVNPVGTMYLAVGSSSGSKFYGLAKEKQYYVAERSNAQKQTFSTLDFSGDTMRIKVYDSDGNPYANDYTITKTREKENPIKFINTASAINKKKFTKASYQALYNALKKIKSTINITPTDKGYRTLITRNGKSNDPLTYYSNANTAYKNPTFGRNLLKKGFSTLLDKTTYTTKRISKTRMENSYAALKTSYAGLKKASLTIKKGKKKLTSKTTITLKPKKSFQIKVSKKPKSGKVTYSSSAKKYVMVSRKGKVTAKKKRKKAVTITVTFENIKTTFKVKVK